MMTITQRHMDRAQQMLDSLRLVGQRPPVTVERVAEVHALVEQLNEQSGTHLRTDSWWIALPDEQVARAHAAVIARGKRRAGVKALERKYGHEAAARIVQKHSGRTIKSY